jgi:hypothetical protein
MWRPRFPLQKSGELGSKKLPGNEQDEMIEDGAANLKPIARSTKPPVRERRSPPKQSAIVASRPIPQSLNRREKIHPAKRTRWREHYTEIGVSSRNNFIYCT